jgi:hypothetical protein
MARRAALIALGVGLLSCGGDDGSNNSWSCSWQCHSNDPPTSGSHTYPNGPNPTAQCTQDYGTGCNDFSCSCNQN